MTENKEAMKRELRKDNERIDISERPKTRDQCPTERPCPFVSCKWNTFLEVNAVTGNIRFNFDVPVDELKVNNCSMDHAESGGITYREIDVVTGGPPRGEMPMRLAAAALARISRLKNDCDFTSERQSQLAMAQDFAFADCCGK